MQHKSPAHLPDTSTRATLLLIDQERGVHGFLRRSLTATNFTLLQAGTGGEGLALASEVLPDVILLDLGLPDLDGNTVIWRLREFCAAPILVLSARTDTEEKIKALDSGASDFVEKPFDLGELLARIRVLLRSKNSTSVPQAIFRNGPLEVDFYHRLVRVNGTAVSLTPREYTLLSLLVHHAGRMLTHRQILFKVWGSAHIGEIQYLRVYIGYLRQKLGPAASLIETQLGVGYRMIKAEPEIEHHQPGRPPSDARQRTYTKAR